MNLKLLGHHLLTPEALRELEDRCDEKWRQAYERRYADALATAQKLQREAELMRAAVERECEQMKSDCRHSIRRQYEVFDREWQAREDKTQARVKVLEAELDRISLHLRTHSEKGHKLLALAIDRRTPEHEAVAAFLKAREHGIRLAHG